MFFIKLTTIMILINPVLGVDIVLQFFKIKFTCLEVYIKLHGN
jgi:hypothetical protein